MRAHERWIEKIPINYRENMLDKQIHQGQLNIYSDPHRLARLRHYHDLVLMAHEAGKPQFLLQPADGAFDCSLKAVQQVYREFRELAVAVEARVREPVG